MGYPITRTPMVYRLLENHRFSAGILSGGNLSRCRLHHDCGGPCLVVALLLMLQKSGMNSPVDMVYDLKLGNPSNSMLVDTKSIKFKAI